MTDSPSASESTPLLSPITLDKSSRDSFRDFTSSDLFSFLDQPETQVEDTSRIFQQPSIDEFINSIETIIAASQTSLTMVDLSTKKVGSITIDQLVQFGRKVQSRIAHYISEQTSKNQRPFPPFFESQFYDRWHPNSFPPREFESDKPDLGYKYWFDIKNPTQDQLKQIQDAFHIHPLTTEDITVTGTREKLEEYSTYLYVVFNERQIVPNSNRYRYENLNILLFPGVIITLHHNSVSSFGQVLYRLQYGFLPNSLPVDWVLYKFLDMITDEFVLMVDSIYFEIDHLDTMVSDIGENNKEDILRRMGVARHFLTQIRGSLLSKREILSILCSTVRVSTFVELGTKIYLRDVMDHIELMIQRLDMATEMLNNTSSIYLTTLSIEMAAIDQRLSEAMKFFGAIATILLPLTVVTGLWGMNVKVPGQGDHVDTLQWFFGIVIGSVLWIVIMGTVFRAKRWL